MCTLDTYCRSHLDHRALARVVAIAATQGGQVLLVRQPVLLDVHMRLQQMFAVHRNGRTAAAGDTALWQPIVFHHQKQEPIQS